MSRKTLLCGLLILSGLSVLGGCKSGGDENKIVGEIKTAPGGASGAPAGQANKGAGMKIDPNR